MTDKLSMLKIFVALIGLSFSSAALSQNEKDPLTASASIQPYELGAGQGAQLKIQMQLPEGYHAYGEQFRVQIKQPEGFKIGKPEISPLKKFFDKTSKKDRLGMAKSATLSVGIEAPLELASSQTSVKVALTYQACSETFCLFPVTKNLEVPIRVAGATPELVNATGSATKDKSLRDRFEDLLGTNKGLALLLVFLAGILTSFTPCIFPMIPITLAILAKDSEKRTRLQNFILSLSYVVGIATTYSLLGLVAASSGAVFGATLGNHYVLSFICLTFLVMALSMYGLFEIQVPAFLRNSLGTSKQGSGLFGAYLSGLIAGLVASPCVGPVLVSILTFVATTKSLLFGFSLLFTYAMGLGLIFLLLGAFTELTRKLPRSGPWMEGTKFVLGSLMLVGFYYYLDLLFPERFFDLALGIGLVVLASVFGAFEKVAGHNHPVRFVRKGLMQAILILGFGFTVLGAFDLRPVIYGRWINPEGVQTAKRLNWKPYSAEAYAQALKLNKPIIIDFYADWCAACHELEQFTFSDPRVRVLSEDFALLQFDATSESQELKQLKQKYRIQGLPTVLFIDSKGQWQDALTLTEFENAEKFLSRMQKIRN